MTSVIQNFFEDFKEGFVSFLSLVVTLWEIWAREIVMNVEGGAKLFHIEVFKVTSMVYKDGGRYVKVANNVIKYELGVLHTNDIDKWGYLNPLGEVICGCDDLFVAF